MYSRTEATAGKKLLWSLRRRALQDRRPAASSGERHVAFRPPWGRCPKIARGSILRPPPTPSLSFGPQRRARGQSGGSNSVVRTGLCGRWSSKPATGLTPHIHAPSPRGTAALLFPDLGWTGAGVGAILAAELPSGPEADRKCPGEPTEARRASRLSPAHGASPRSPELLLGCRVKHQALVS